MKTITDAILDALFHAVVVAVWAFLLAAVHLGVNNILPPEATHGR